MKKKKTERTWGIYKKGDWRCLMICHSQEHANECINGYENKLEVREIINDFND